MLYAGRMRVDGLQQVFNSLRQDSLDVPACRQGFTCLRSDRISPDQGCLEIAVMLKESVRFRHLAAKARRSALAIVFFDRNVALICVFAIGAYKPV
ncbi:hypothetical protein R69746_00525 [Paraburkholderia aspalathi]|uniref:hypothetical protein n=1 Tax=Paraburkholderia aspalathi TaxID=1324617 RepID=UPI00190D32D8|nr:hypothetical protein [Paraburkholderia aspalathi]MBK3836851.1 hypothetical protein [Paraburkholderia aspalathi]CAE6697352.1 hypothetical protein R69746_00525 [Paraburkholderia aspalathi]CAE6738244.1 hypothetical protein R75465_02142 [Paraburkholderia aspalathi]